MSLALLPGSYDPMTLGHLDIVRRAAALYEEVVVAVMDNPNKTYVHSAKQRVRIAELTVAELPSVRVVYDEGLVVDLFERLGADVIIKGIRNDRDRAYEEEMAEWNLAHDPRAKTLFLEAADDFETVSSTEVRRRLAQNEVPEGYVADAVIDYWRAEGILPKRK